MIVHLGGGRKIDLGPRSVVTPTTQAWSNTESPYARAEDKHSEHAKKAKRDTGGKFA